MASTNGSVVDYSEDRNIRTAEQNWDSALAFAKQSNTYKLINALTSKYGSIDRDIEDIYKQIHIDTATGRQLDQFGELVSVERKYNESDDKYRARIKSTFRASTIGTTYDEFTRFCSTVLNRNVEDITFVTNYLTDSATIIIQGESSIYDESIFTQSEIIDLLNKGVPAGHEVDIAVEGGSFILKSDGETDDASKGLTSDTIDTGGTIYEEIQ